MLVKNLLVGFLLVCGMSVAQADMAASDGQGNYIVLHKDACSNTKVLAVIPKEVQGMFRSAEAILGKNHFDACWAVMPDGSNVALVYEDGDMGVVPVTAFNEKGV